jgi:c-di-GMP phosphodiesterase
LQHAQELGFRLFQGNLLERAGVLDRAGARPVND